MQTIGTHNSYHVTPDDAIRKLLTRSSVRALLGSAAAAQIPSAWEATQAPLGTQIGQYGERSMAILSAGSAVGKGDGKHACPQQNGSSETLTCRKASPEMAATRGPWLHLMPSNSNSIST